MFILECVCVRACRLTHRLRVLVSLVEVAMGDERVSACYLQKLCIGNRKLNNNFIGFLILYLSINCMILANIAMNPKFPFILVRDQTVKQINVLDLVALDLVPH